jgi:hypothetical protein
MQVYDENCHGCKPTLIDINTCAALPDDSAVMQAVFKVFDGLTLAQR